jgi:hypothetical protein
MRCLHLDSMNSFRNHRLRDIAISPSMIRLRLRDLKAAGRIECLGRGPGAKWRKRVTPLKEGKKEGKNRIGLVTNYVFTFEHLLQQAQRLSG